MDEIARNISRLRVHFHHYVTKLKRTHVDKISPGGAANTTTNRYTVSDVSLSVYTRTTQSLVRASVNTTSQDAEKE